ELPRPVVRDVAPPTRLDAVDPQPRARALAHEDMGRIGATPQRDDRIVLEEEEGVADVPAHARFDERGLEIVGFAVGDSPEEMGGYGALFTGCIHSFRGENDVAFTRGNWAPLR